MFKKIIKILPILLCVFFVANVSLGISDDPTSWISPPTNTNITKLRDLGNAVLGIVQVVGIGCGTIATLVLAIRYMYSSPDEKADVKKKLIPFIIGGFLVFGAVQLVKIVEVFTNEII